MWKISSEQQNEFDAAPFPEGPKFFAVEASHSKDGPIVDRKRHFVAQIRDRFADTGDSIAVWGETCDDPTHDFSTVQWGSGAGRRWGQYPGAIFAHTTVVNAIKDSQLLFLVLDTVKIIWEWEQYVQTHGTLNVPVIFVCVDFRNKTPRMVKADLSNAFFSMPHALILFKDAPTRRIYTIAAKGCFAQLSGIDQDLDNWDELPMYSGETEFFEHCAKLGIKVPTKTSRKSLSNRVTLGTVWNEANGGPCPVDLDLLLQAGLLSDADISHLFNLETLLQLANLYNGRHQFRTFCIYISSQKTGPDSPRLEDVSSAAKIIISLTEEKHGTSARHPLQQQLREAHRQNMLHFQRAVLAFKGSPREATAKKRVDDVNFALRVLDLVHMYKFQLPKTWSREDLLKPHAESVPSDDPEAAMICYNLEGPASRGTCTLCWAEDAIMSICLHQLASRRHNEVNHGLNFPLAAGRSSKNMGVISTNNVCFQCALLLPAESPVFAERITAIIPTIEYKGPNKAYLNNQLRMALTHRYIATDSCVAQLFMATLDGTLQDPTWTKVCRERSQVYADPEDQVFRKFRTVEWMLGQFVNNTWVDRSSIFRSGSGTWVTLPHLLKDLADDFRDKARNSVLIRMHRPGFDTILSLSQRVTLSSKWSTELVRRMRVARALGEIITKCWLRDRCLPWAKPKPYLPSERKYIGLLYREIASQVTPKDLGGPDSIIDDVDMFFARLMEDHGPMAKGFAIDPQDMVFFMRKVQFGIFWMLYRRQKPGVDGYSWSLPDKYYHKAVGDPAISVPEQEFRSLLTSIFAPLNEELFTDPLCSRLHADSVPPFKSPWGPSVFRCGVESCSAPFLILDQNRSPQPHHVEMMKKNRAEHLSHAYGLKGHAEDVADSQQPMKSGNIPSLLRMGIHSNIVKTWTANSQKRRRAIIRSRDNGDTHRGEDYYEVFITSVKERISKHGGANICDPRLDGYIRDALPSFFAILAEALKIEGKDEEDIAVYKHKFAEKTLEARIRYELMTSVQEG